MNTNPVNEISAYAVIVCTTMTGINLQVKAYKSALNAEW